MKTVLLSALLLPGAVFAHPGHGSPGWAHPHLADAALVLFAVLAFSAIVFLIGKALKR